MTIEQIIVIAVVQGITEFLPISSSGHLILVPYIMHWPDQGQFVDVMVLVCADADVRWRRQLAHPRDQGVSLQYQKKGPRVSLAQQKMGRMTHHEGHEDHEEKKKKLPVSFPNFVCFVVKIESYRNCAGRTRSLRSLASGSTGLSLREICRSGPDLQNFFGQRFGRRYRQR